MVFVDRRSSRPHRFNLLRSSFFQVYYFIFSSFHTVLSSHFFTGLFLQAANKLSQSVKPDSSLQIGKGQYE